MRWLAYWLGLHDANSGPYLFWSGIGGCVRDFGAFVVLPVVMWKHHSKQHHGG